MQAPQILSTYHHIMHSNVTLRPWLLLHKCNYLKSIVFLAPRNALPRLVMHTCLHVESMVFCVLRNALPRMVMHTCPHLESILLLVLRNALPLLVLYTCPQLESIMLRVLRSALPRMVLHTCAQLESIVLLVVRKALARLVLHTCNLEGPGLNLYMSMCALRSFSPEKPVCEEGEENCMCPQSGNKAVGSDLAAYQKSMGKSFKNRTQEGYHRLPE